MTRIGRAGDDAGQETSIGIGGRRPGGGSRPARLPCGQTPMVAEAGQHGCLAGRTPWWRGLKARRCLAGLLGGGRAAARQEGGREAREGGKGGPGRGPGSRSGPGRAGPDLPGLCGRGGCLGTPLPPLPPLPPLLPLPPLPRLLGHSCGIRLLVREGGRMGGYGRDGAKSVAQARPLTLCTRTHARARPHMHARARTSSRGPARARAKTMRATPHHSPERPGGVGRQARLPARAGSADKRARSDTLGPAWPGPARPGPARHAGPVA